MSNPRYISILLRLNLSAHRFLSPVRLAGGSWQGEHSLDNKYMKKKISLFWIMIAAIWEEGAIFF
jgi:hypothetical protein